MNPMGRGLPSISVVVATYDRADYLRICLECLISQDYEGHYDIIVADDGSTDHTPEVISEARRKAGALQIQHSWHEHDVYRRAYNLNEGSRMATGEILVFLDSDCLPDVNLLSAYAAFSEPASYYLGGVYFLNEEFTKAALKNNQIFSPQDFRAQAALPTNQRKGAATRVLKRLWKSKLHAALKVGQPKIWGGNFAVNRDLFEKINGFDENYFIVSQEDSDIRNRFVKGGYRGVALQTKARVFHLWHPIAEWRIHITENKLNDHKYYKRPNLEVVCKNGLLKL